MIHFLNFKDRTKSALAIFVAVLVFSCEEKKPTEVKRDRPPKVIDKEALSSYLNCHPDSTNCTYAKISYPYFTDSADSYLNAIIQYEIIDITSFSSSSDVPNDQVQSVTEQFVQEFKNFKQEFTEYDMGWFLEGQSEIINNSTSLLSIRSSVQVYSGGAHPNTNVQYLIFDKINKKRLQLTDIVADTMALKNVLEKNFRIERGIPENESLADAGFYIEDGDFYLTNNLGIDENSLFVYYNAYEIGPYSLGPTLLEISRNELKDILKL